MLDETAFQGVKLCVVGNINRDVKPGMLAPGDYLFSDGETGVGSMEETIGGGGANSAFAAAALGARVAFVGKVGADAGGERLERTLTKHGLEPHLAKDPVNPSGASIALSFEGGRRHFVSCLPASRALSHGDINIKAMAGCRHLFRADIWFSESMLFEGNKMLFQAARKSGVTTSIDLNWDPFWGKAGTAEIASRKQAVRESLPWVSLAHGNVCELREFADAADLETALKRISDWGVASVVVHLGSQGAGYWSDGCMIIGPPAPVKQHVNAAGTGDVLSVCMMLLHGRTDVPVQERLRLSNAVVGQFIEGSRRLIPPLAD